MSDTVSTQAMFVDLLKVLNNGCITEMKLLNDPCLIKICKGVRQGDTVPPKLFALTLEALFNDHDWIGGIEIDGERLTHMLSADDRVILAYDAVELQHKHCYRRVQMRWELN